MIQYDFSLCTVYVHEFSHTHTHTHARTHTRHTHACMHMHTHTHTHTTLHTHTHNTTHTRRTHTHAQYYDLAADVLAENAHLTYKCLSPYLYEFIDARIMQQTSPEAVQSDSNLSPIPLQLAVLALFPGPHVHQAFHVVCSLQGPENSV